MVILAIAKFLNAMSFEAWIATVLFIAKFCILIVCFIVDTKLTIGFAIIALGIVFAKLIDCCSAVMYDCTTRI